MTILKRLALTLIILMAVVVAGTIGFVALEGLSAFEGLYLTVITITTVGYGDISPITPAGRILAMGLVVTGFTFFTSVVVTTVHLVFEQREERRHAQQFHTLTSLFFSEIGEKLLRLFCRSDPKCQEIREATPGRKLTPADFTGLAETLKNRPFDIDPKRLDSQSLRTLLDSQLLLTLLQNPHVFEDADFNNLIRAGFHLRGELAAHPGFPDLSEAILSHIASDARKVYQPSVKVWLGHMRYMKKAYPSLFFTMLKSNPFGAGEATATEDFIAAGK